MSHDVSTVRGMPFQAPPLVNCSINDGPSYVPEKLSPIMLLNALGLRGRTRT